MMDETHITLAHGNGGRRMRALIEQIFARHLASPALDIQADAVPLVLPPGEVLFTTDGFTVQPLEFPGGDIGSLAVHGTVNDLAVCGAVPAYISLNVFVEEGFPLVQLDRIVASLAQAARDCGAAVATGDTKVVAKGEGGGLYLATTGIGTRPPGLRLGLSEIRPGDVLLVSGPVGDHGTAVLLARESFGLRGDLASDSASVLPFAQALVGRPGLRFMRDPTRGGLATVVHEIARATGHAVRLYESEIPLRPSVQAVCEMLGYDPLYLACEGRVVAVLAPEAAAAALAAWHALPGGEAAAVIGRIEPGSSTAGFPQAILQTALGGERLLDELDDDPLPRIC